MIRENASRITITTPEAITFSYELAGPVVRLLAALIDVCAVGAASDAIGKLSEALRLVGGRWAVAVGYIAYFMISVGYAILFEWRWRGQTVGKRALRIRVVDASGLRLTFPQIALRNLLRPVDQLPLFYLVGALFVILTREAQRLGDIAAGTVVIRTQRPTGLIVPPTIRTPGVNSFIAYPHLVNRVRQRAPVELLQIAIAALERRDELEPSARLRLFEEIEARWRALETFPEEITAYLTPEQYVRRLLDAVTRVRQRPMK